MAAIEFSCTNCQKQIKAPSGLCGRSGRCPRCQAKIDIPIQETDEDTESSTGLELTFDESHSYQTAEPPPLQSTPPKGPALVLSSQRDQAKSRQLVTVPPARRLYMPPKTVRLIIFLVLYPGLGCFAALSSLLLAGFSEPFNSQGLAMLACLGPCCFVPLWAMVGFFPAWILSRYLSVPFVKVLRCPRCGFESDAVAEWSSGGYNDHKEKHILLFRNPLDGSGISHKVCEQCDTTILVQERWPLQHWWSSKG